ncbi:F0F1 ATP synthase subunit delta [Xylophilus rhododendri]|jgi:F-type H+-transporting ATPase subunit delta|uniref:ATP synthase subunit delta n=1 Tax=Xylophilus rhododendri TaxID=2697032 RepID=A0A857J7Q7_9BURK|nr:F0F1 ATP synthase subunit delta [Xylophilus rhododendri]QHI99101.1 F0F1 ATP synthase subunit delta [Xylophilus rhododendri]
MAEIATIARPYAEALFQATPADQRDAALAWVDELGAIAADPQIAQLAHDPKVDAAQRFELIASVARTPLPEAARNFLRVVIDNGRLAALPEVAHQFRALRNAQGGSSDAVVYSAFPIGDAALADLGATLQKRFGRPLNLSVVIDSSLIGGVRVAVGDEVLDTSVRARLDHMKAALAA